MKLAVMYAGQGSQKVGMGRDLYEDNADFRKILDSAAGLMDFDLEKTMFEGPDEVLSETSHTQPALAAFAAGVTEILRKRGVKPAYAAGLSLGEYSALYASGVLTLPDLMRITRFRGAAMRDAGAGIDTLMCALIGCSAETAEDVCAKARAVCMEQGLKAGVSVSNYNSTEQNVISGDREAVKKAEEIAKKCGVKRCMELRTSSAFHTPIMQPASDRLNGYLADVRLGHMQIPVILNVTGRPLADGTPDESARIRELMAKQVVTGVRMAQTILYLRDQGVDTVIEVGPGKAISGFIRKTAPEIHAIAIDGAKDLAKLDELYPEV